MLSFKEILKELNLPPEVKKSIIALELAQKNWEKIILSDLSKKTRPFSFNHGTLIIEVPNHYYLQILSSQTLEILEKLESFTPPNLKPLFKNCLLYTSPSPRD